jgi:hypothetical protein
LAKGSAFHAKERRALSARGHARELVAADDPQVGRVLFCLQDRRLPLTGQILEGVGVEQRLVETRCVGRRSYRRPAGSRRPSRRGRLSSALAIQSLGIGVPGPLGKQHPSPVTGRAEAVRRIDKKHVYSWVDAAGNTI